MQDLNMDHIQEELVEAIIEQTAMVKFYASRGNLSPAEVCALRELLDVRKAIITGELF